MTELEAKQLEKIPVGQAKDLTGQKFNRLTVFYRVKWPSSGAAQWLCKCDCGEWKVVSA